MEEKVFITIDGSGVRVRLSNGTTETFKPEEIQTINIVEDGPRVILNTKKGFKQYTTKQSYENLIEMASWAKEKQEKIKSNVTKTIPELNTKTYQNQGLYYENTPPTLAAKAIMAIFFLFFFVTFIGPILFMFVVMIISFMFVPYSQQTPINYDYYSDNIISTPTSRESAYGEKLILKLNEAIKVSDKAYNNSYLKFTGIGWDSYSFYDGTNTQTPRANFELYEDGLISYTTSLQEKETTKNLLPQLDEIIYMQQVVEDTNYENSFIILTKEPTNFIYDNVERETGDIYEWRKLVPNTTSPASCEDLCIAKQACAYQGDSDLLSCRRTTSSFGTWYEMNYKECSGGTIVEEDLNSVYCCCKKSN